MYGGKCHEHCLKKAEEIPPILSASLVTYFKFKFGKVEIIAKMPAGDWILPGGLIIIAS